MNVCFYTLGCKVNQYETEAMAELMKNGGYTVCAPDGIADIAVINSCTVTEESDRKVGQLMRRLRRNDPNVIIVLTGCLPQAFPEKAQALSEADIILGNTNRSELLPAVEAFLVDHRRVVSISRHENGEGFSGAAVTGFSGRTRAFMKIEDGCNGFCSYCIIPYARGRVRSKSLIDISEEAAALAKSGFKEIVLAGINLSSYGEDLGLGLCDAAEAVAATAGIERVRLGSLEPDTVTPAMIERLAKIDKLCPQFHLSLQSGCDATLERMRRRYDSADYRALVDTLRRCFADCAITTDIMVGFAGESDDEFEQSLRFVSDIGFARAHVFSYSVRPGTIAAKLDGQVDKRVKEERSRRMTAVTDSSRKKFSAAQIGKIYPVLFERRGSDGRFEGYTPNYTQVKADSERDLHNVIVPVRLTAVEVGYCAGEIIETV